MRILKALRFCRIPKLAIQRNPFEEISAIALVSILFVVLIYLTIKGHFLFLFGALFSIYPPILLYALYSLLNMWKIEQYLQKNHFKLWKQYHSFSVSESYEAFENICSLKDPNIEGLWIKEFKLRKMLFWIWLSFVWIALIVIAFAMEII